MPVYETDLGSSTTIATRDAKNLNSYKELKWSCKYCGMGGLTYAQALKQEQLCKTEVAASAIKSPLDVLPLIVYIVHGSPLPIEALVTKVLDVSWEVFFQNEEANLIVKDHDSRMEPAVIKKIVIEKKEGEESVVYRVEVTNSGRKETMDVVPADLRKKESSALLGSTIRNWILDFATKGPEKESCWEVDEGIVNNCHGLNPASAFISTVRSAMEKLSQGTGIKSEQSKSNKKETQGKFPCQTISDEEPAETNLMASEIQALESAQLVSASPWRKGSAPVESEKRHSVLPHIVDLTGDEGESDATPTEGRTPRRSKRQKSLASSDSHVQQSMKQFFNQSQKNGSRDSALKAGTKKNGNKTSGIHGLKGKPKATVDAAVEVGKKSKSGEKVFQNSKKMAKLSDILEAEKERPILNPKVNADRKEGDTKEENAGSRGVCSKCRRKSHPTNSKLIECSHCHRVYHCQCLSPPLTDVPAGPWCCTLCSKKTAVTNTKHTTASGGSKQAADWRNEKDPLRKREKALRLLSEIRRKYPLDDSEVEKAEFDEMLLSLELGQKQPMARPTIPDSSTLETALGERCPLVGKFPGDCVGDLLEISVLLNSLAKIYEEIPKLTLPDLIEAIMVPEGSPRHSLDRLMVGLFQVIIAAGAGDYPGGYFAPGITDDLMDDWLENLSHATWQEIVRRYFSEARKEHSKAEEVGAIVHELSTRKSTELSIPILVKTLHNLCIDLLGSPDTKEYIEENVNTLAELNKERYFERINERKEKRAMLDIKLDSMLAAGKEHDAEEDVKNAAADPSYLEKSIDDKQANISNVDIEKLRRRDAVRRAEDAKKGEEERKRTAAMRKLEEERIRKEEQYERNVSKLLIKIDPLGYDRENRRYWFFPTERSFVFVELKSMPEWRCYCAKEQIEQLLEALNPNGIRERKLIESLNRVVDKFGSKGAQKKSKYALEEAKIPEIDAINGEAAGPDADVEAEKKIIVRIRGDGPFQEEPGMVDTFRRRLLNLVKKLNEIHGEGTGKRQSQVDKATVSEWEGKLANVGRLPVRESVDHLLDVEEKVVLVFEGIGRAGEMESELKITQEFEVGEIEKVHKNVDAVKKLWGQESERNEWRNDVKECEIMSGLVLLAGLLRNRFDLATGYKDKKSSEADKEMSAMKAKLRHSKRRAAMDRNVFKFDAEDDSKGSSQRGSKPEKDKNSTQGNKASKGKESKSKSPKCEICEQDEEDSEEPILVCSRKGCSFSVHPTCAQLARVTRSWVCQECTAKSAAKSKKRKGGDM